ncbi:MAG: hypothetical protein GF347_05410 [Candidatus Moranbacteria bacterium]|nr:hypothetical protein [Candidatus Moranbacteria bacterium]
MSVILFIADLLVYFYYPETAVSKIFLATREQTPLTWLSAVAILFIALSCSSNYLRTNEKIWYFLAVIFFFFSMDDAVYFHERLSGFIADNTNWFASFPTYIWVILYFPLIIFSLGSLVFLLWKDKKAKNKKLLVIAVIVLGLAVFLDLLDGYIQKNQVLFFDDSFSRLTFTHFIRLSEEMMELYALGCLGYINITRYSLIKKLKIKN